MADLPSSGVKINDIEVAANAPVSESLFSKLGSSINYLLDQIVVNAGNITTNTNDITALQAQFDFASNGPNTGSLGAGNNVVFQTGSFASTTGRVQVTVKGTLVKVGGSGTGTDAGAELAISIDGVQQTATKITCTFSDNNDKQSFSITYTFTTSATAKQYGLFFITAVGAGSQPTIELGTVQAVEF